MNVVNRMICMRTTAAVDKKKTSTSSRKKSLIQDTNAKIATTTGTPISNGATYLNRPNQFVRSRYEFLASTSHLRLGTSQIPPRQEFLLLHSTRDVDISLLEGVLAGLR